MSIHTGASCLRMIYHCQCLSRSLRISPKSLLAIWLRIICCPRALTKMAILRKMKMVIRNMINRISRVLRTKLSERSCTRDHPISSSFAAMSMIKISISCAQWMKTSKSASTEESNQTASRFLIATKKTQMKLASVIKLPSYLWEVMSSSLIR